ncbi:hypothetical protein BBK14_11285 [Parafrankia soli]|uniref:Phage portal protein n=2 Tax=Parafrankia soli TaxID=2599596 RepID=A0A1S1R8C5_9ACTN|nr:hypothetical protein BBK14_11285 [Parafrankia soli]
MRDSERPRLDRIHDYLCDDPARRLPGLPEQAPAELHRLARISRVNMLKFVVSGRVQAMYVDGYREPRAADNVAAWDVWQRNRCDARQIGVHRAALAYGAAYVTVLPGTPVPVLRGVSPRRMTAAYGDDDDWPKVALERTHSGWRLYDAEAVYLLEAGKGSDGLAAVGSDEHGAGVCPVVRMRETEDLDDEVVGVVEPLIPLQDQINITTFGLLVAQHYGAFRQRYIIGWMAEDEEAKLKASASKLWTFEDSPQEISVGEFGQTDLSGYIASREASLRHLATISQTPAHELLGELVNLSADALVAAEASHRRAVTENQTVMGEGWEQALALAGTLMGDEPDAAAEVRWRDTESRSMAQVADALGKMAQMLGVPPAELWEMLPGVSQQQVERWRAAAAEGDAFARLTSTLQRQAAPAAPAPAAPAEV